jgi:hypothetical protein
MSEWAKNLNAMTTKQYGTRVKTGDWVEAVMIADEIQPMIGDREVIIGGFSRGGGIAQVLALELTERGIVWVYAYLFAPKRSTGRNAKRSYVFAATAHRGDIVPYLPPWLGGPPMTWFGRFTWFWKAHDKAGHDAARWRHELTK